MKNLYFLLCLLFFSLNAQSQHSFHSSISLDTIGVSPVELPRYADKHNIKRMTKVLLRTERNQSLVLGDGRDINIGNQKGMILDVKEYDWRGNITLDVEYAALGPYDKPYEYVYDENEKRKIIESSDKSGTYQTNLKRYYYNEQNQLDFIQRIDLYIYKQDSSYSDEGSVFFDYDNLDRIEKMTFLYRNLRSNTIDTTGIVLYEYRNDTCIIAKYNNHSSSLYFYTLIYDKQGRVIEQQNEYRTEKYEYNAAGWISKKIDYNRKGEQNRIIDYLYDENSLLVGEEQYSNPKHKTEIIYVYEFY